MKFKQSEACKQLIRCITKRGNRAFEFFFEMKKELFSDKKEVNKFVIKPSFLTSCFGGKKD